MKNLSISKGDKVKLYNGIEGIITKYSSKDDMMIDRGELNLFLETPPYEGPRFISIKKEDISDIISLKSDLEREEKLTRILTPKKIEIVVNNSFTLYILTKTSNSTSETLEQNFDNFVYKYLDLLIIMED